MHLCRGNGGRGQDQPAGWHTSGRLRRASPSSVFGGLDVDRFLLEYDSERAGGFEPLRFVPQGKMVVLGLVTTKSGELESQDALLRRIDEAAQYVAARRPGAEPAVRLRLDAGRAIRCRWTSSGASWSWWSTRRARCGARLEWPGPCRRSIGATTISLAGSACVTCDASISRGTAAAVAFTVPIVSAPRASEPNVAVRKPLHLIWGEPAPRDDGTSRSEPSP